MLNGTIKYYSSFSIYPMRRISSIDIIGQCVPRRPCILYLEFTTSQKSTLAIGQPVYTLITFTISIVLWCQEKLTYHSIKNISHEKILTQLLSSQNPIQISIQHVPAKLHKYEKLVRKIDCLTFISESSTLSPIFNKKERLDNKKGFQWIAMYNL